MESVYTLLTERARALKLAAETPNRDDPNKPWRAVVAFAGPPGSGKTTIAREVAHRLNGAGNNNSINGTPGAVVVIPMDGFHYTRAHLDTLPNPAEAHARRGAAWTFDAAGVVALVKALDASRQAPRAAAKSIRAPSFDHATKDPVVDDIEIPPSATLVILEGNWLLYDEEPWRQIGTFVDETWFVDVDPEVARRRIAVRHVQSGIEATLADGLRRAGQNDVPNGEEVRRKLIKPTVTVQSVDEDI
ncbi:P-loop containing nucleoside triphosphate hydrolase protein [Xylariales sp. PMI_506]|nr:P-loop containing nucleoside triphosphate hydrolase protein [Xylariales sp. PMI_506]